MEALKAIKIIGNQNDGRAVFLFLSNTGYGYMPHRMAKKKEGLSKSQKHFIPVFIS